MYILPPQFVPHNLHSPVRMQGWWPTSDADLHALLRVPGALLLDGEPTRCLRRIFWLYAPLHVPRALLLDGEPTSGADLHAPLHVPGALLLDGSEDGALPMLPPRRCRCCRRGGLPMLPPRRSADALPPRRCRCCCRGVVVVAEGGSSRCRRVVPSVSEAGRQVSEVGVCRRNRLLRLRVAHLFASSSPGATSSPDLLLGS